MKVAIIAILAASLAAAAPARTAGKNDAGGNNIANSAAGLANSIQKGNGGDIAKAALDLASSISGGAGAGAFFKREGASASDVDEDEEDDE
ncbi:hypothetical protein K4F52_005171 [Lecanicillium sp. MT-2017a]|nr:hypothetical protein K4F52_005171 [Lecanicillium sp. MT-2017a]